jgi:predicted kinase
MASSRQTNTKNLDNAVPIAFDAAEAERENLRRINVRRETLKTLADLGLQSYDYGTKIEVYLPGWELELSVDVSDAAVNDVVPRILAQLYERAFEAGRIAERETQADALMAAVPALADRMRKIADEAIIDARWAERNDRDQY